METVIRVLILYLFVLFGLRMLGKREFGELAPFDLVVLLLIPEFISQAVLREDFSVTNGFIALSTLFTLVFLTSLASYRSRRFGNAIGGTPTVIVRHGHLVVHSMEKERVRPDEILDAMHQVGLTRMEQVQWAILETDGRIAIIPWEDAAWQPPATEHAAK